MKSIRLLIILILMVLAFGCSTVSYQYDYDPEVNYTDLKTYSWESVSVQEYIHLFNAKRLQKAVDAQLEAKGYKMENENPDFLVSMHSAKEDKVDVVTLNSSYRERAMYDNPYPANSQLRVFQYEESTLILDIVDTESGDVIWIGTAKEEVRNYSDPVKRNERIDLVVQKVLSNFPPPR